MDSYDVRDMEDRIDDLREALDDARGELHKLRNAAVEAEAFRNLLRMQPLEDMVKSHFGPRCAEYDENCVCCRAWRWLDVVHVVVGADELNA